MNCKDFMPSHLRLSYILLPIWLGTCVEGFPQSNQQEFVLQGVVAVGAQPEAIIRDGDALLVSSLGSDDSAASSDGSITRLLWDGSVDSTFQLGTALNNPMGIVTVGDQIAVVDIDRVVIIERSGELASEISLAQSGPVRLNDITRVSDTQVIVSATNIKKLLPTGQVKALQVDFVLHNPNGLSFDQETSDLYMTDNIQNTIGEEGNGSLTKIAIDLAAGSGRRIFSSPIGKFVDGIDRRGNSIAIADWIGFDADGATYMLSAQTGDIIARRSVAVRGFADLAWNADGEQVACVSLVGNQVQFFSEQKPPN